MSKKKEYYRPYIKGTNIPAFELGNHKFNTYDEAIKFVKEGNPFYTEDKYEIRKVD